MAGPVVGDVDEAAGVGYVIGGVEDAPAFELGAVARLGQLVVGGAGDDAGMQQGDGAVVENGAQRARREDVGLDAVDGVGGHGGRPELGGGAPDGAFIDVGDEEAGAGLGQVAAQGVTDAAQALHGDADAAQLGASQAVLDGRPNGHVDAERRHRRRVAAAARGAAHEPRLRGDDVHVGGRGADVLGGDVAPAERIDKAPEGAHEVGALVAPGVAEDDRLAAADGQAGDGRLVGHAARQAQGVGQRLVVRCIVPHAAPAKGRAEARVVDGDDAFEAGRGVGTEGDQFVVLEIGARENGHDRSS